MLKILPYDKNHIDKSYGFLMDSFQISWGPDKAKWPNGLGSYPLEQYRTDIEKLLTYNSVAIFSVFHGDQTVGQIELRKLKDGSGFVSFYYLVPEFRNKGLGKQLDDFAINELKRRGCTRVRLTVGELNKAAQRFYEKSGWKLLGADPTRPQGLTMEKEI
ncbi:GNAT family N-acetyltransferase [Bdellovibrio sp. HCB337]|uniref:GNAT family N-acetyltransferase n=1 Tax=Bdellovibrio sp. HCB337 TaxID=3394358 RepID=UPI0039A47D6F